MNEIPRKTKLKDRTYQVESLYTKGGQSYIYIATNLREQNSRVILKQGKLNDSNEFEILRELDHPLLPRVIEEPFIEEIDGEDYQFLVMEFIDGQTLRSIIKETDVPYLQTLSWAKQLLDILIYLQTPNREIVHKDICPNNIIVDRSSRVYLIDFGLSKKANTYDSSIGGTENYMPPEQFTETGITDFRSDIYSLSATVYHLLTTRKPEKSIDRKAAIDKAEPDPLQPIAEICKGLPESFSNLISRGMSLKPEQRPANAMQMKSLLEQVEQDIPSQSFPEDLPPFEPEIVTQTSPTRIKNPGKIHIPIKQPKSTAKNWGISSMKRGSEAHYSLYFLEDALKAADKDERKAVKNRFISVIGEGRISSDAELSKLLNILKNLCATSSAADEESLRQEIQYYRQNAEPEFESAAKPTNNSLNNFIDQNSRKIKLYSIRIALFFGLLIFILLIRSVYNSYYPAGSEIPAPPVASPTAPGTVIGKKGKTSNDINLRQDARQDSADIGTLYLNSEVEILEIAHNDSKGKSTVWYKVKVLSYGCSKKNPSKCGKDNPADADEGWVSSQFITGLK